MLGGSLLTKAPKSASTITALAVIFLGAVAFAIPEGPIEVTTDAPRGMLVAHVDVSDDLAVQLAKSGYSFLAVDLTGGDVSEGSHLHRHLRNVARRFTLWAWIDARAGAARAQRVLERFPFKGVFLYGPGASDAARALSGDERNDGLVVHAVHRADAAPEVAACVAYPPAAFPGEGVTMPVLLAETLGMREIEEARARAAGGYLVAPVRVPELEAKGRG